MAYSIIEFSGKNKRFHELDLSIACVLIIEKYRNIANGKYDAMFDKWLESITFSGSGCIDLHLDEYLQDRKLRLVIRELAKSVLQDLDEIGDLYPKITLNKLLAKAKINLENDYRVSLIRSVIEGLNELIE